MDSQASTISKSCGRPPENIGLILWKLWQHYRDYIYNCCLKWMNENPTDAGSVWGATASQMPTIRGMLQAWEKMQKFEGKIANFKASIAQLTYTFTRNSLDVQFD